MLLTYHIKYPSAVGLTFAFVTDIMAHRGGHFNKSNAESSHGRRRSDVINQVPRDPSKRTMITLDGGGSARDELWTLFKDFFQWEVVADVLVCEVWEDSMRKLYPGLMSNARDESIKMARLNGVEFDGSNFSVLKPYNLEWIESSYWEDMIYRVWNKKSKLLKHYGGLIAFSQLKRRLKKVPKIQPDNKPGAKGKDSLHIHDTHRRKLEQYHNLNSPPAHTSLRITRMNTLSKQSNLSKHKAHIQIPKNSAVDILQTRLIIHDILQASFRNTNKMIR
ncbi:hypothetical protein Tco_0479487 [Tanacetum coccineum]